MAFQSKPPFVPFDKDGSSMATARATARCATVCEGTSAGTSDSSVEGEAVRSVVHVDLGDGSEIEWYPRFFNRAEADLWLQVLDKEMPWTRPTLFIYGRPCIQPRESCYVADRNLPNLKYSGHQPVAYHWDEFPVLKTILHAVEQAVPDTEYNSVLINRYANGSDYAAWHSDNEKLYGPSPVIASVSLGAEREFFVRMKKGYKLQKEKEKNGGSMQVQRPRRKAESNTVPRSTTKPSDKGECGSADVEGAREDPVHHSPGKHKGDHNMDQPATKMRRLNSEHPAPSCSPLTTTVHGATPKEQYSFVLKHGSLLVMKGNMQRDWDHSVPKRTRSAGLRINLTFRKVYVPKQGHL